MRGFDVLSSASLAPARTFQEVPPAQVYDRAIAHTPSEADAVFIGGNRNYPVDKPKYLLDDLPTVTGQLIAANPTLFKKIMRKVLHYEASSGKIGQLKATPSVPDGVAWQVPL